MSKGIFATPKREFFQFKADDVKKFIHETGLAVQEIGSRKDKFYFIPALNTRIKDEYWLYFDNEYGCRVISDSEFKNNWNVIE